MIFRQTAAQRLAYARAHRSRGGQRGAVAVEAALVTPLLLLLVFGIIEFGMIFKDWLAVTSSVRSGARIASAEPRNTNFAQDAANQVAREGGALDMDNVTALWVYRADPAYLSSTGAPIGGGGTFSNCTVCVKFTWNGTAFVKNASPTWASTTQNACQGDPAHDSVGVYLKIAHPSVTGLIFSQLNLAEHTVMSLEPMSGTAVCKP